MVLICCFAILPHIGSAQSGVVSTDPPPPPPDPVDTPIDGGLSILIGAGVLYGIKKAKDNRKQKKEGENVSE